MKKSKIEKTDVKVKTKAEELNYMDMRQVTFLINDVDILSDISRMCLVEARSSEFQLGYEALHIRIEKYNKVANFVIPIAYYNFKQEVTGASVEYELADVTAAYEVIKGTTNIEQLNGLLNTVKMLEGLDYTVSFGIGDFGSIHRHPSRSEFSYIDLKNDPDSPGIIYRKSDFKGLQVDSIIYIDKNEASRTEMFHAEARMVDIESSENGVTGTYQKHPCHIVNFCDRGFISNEPISFDDLLNFKDEIIENDEDMFYYLADMEADNSLLKSIMMSYKESNFKPSYDTVDPKNITQEIYNPLANRCGTLGSYRDFGYGRVKDLYPTYYEHNLGVEDEDEFEMTPFKLFTTIEVEDLASGDVQEIEDLVEDASADYHDPALKYKNVLFDRFNKYTKVINGKRYTLVDYKSELDMI